MGFRVYAIECADGSIYVGETWKSFQERFQEHCEGIRSRLRKRTTPVRLLRHLCVDGLRSREDSRAEERALALRLERRGVHVRGGH